MNDYYVYCIFSTDGTPRYIGASCSNRVEMWSYPSSWGYNPIGEWLKFMKGPPEIRRIITGLSFEEGLAWERQLIDFIGRQCQGTGPLLNVQRGGFGKDSGNPGRRMVGQPRKPTLGPRVTSRGLVVSRWVG